MQTPFGLQFTVNAVGEVYLLGCFSAKVKMDESLGAKK